MSSGRRRRRRRKKSWAEISHALTEIRVLRAEATLDKCISGSGRNEKTLSSHFASPQHPLHNCFFFSSSCFSKMRYKHNRWSSPNGSLHPRCHFFPHIRALDSATWQEWDYLSERSIKSLPDPSCILGQHPSLCSIPCHKITILPGQKKKPIITKITTESNFLLSL